MFIVFWQPFQFTTTIHSPQSFYCPVFFLSLISFFFLHFNQPKWFFVFFHIFRLSGKEIKMKKKKIIIMIGNVSKNAFILLCRLLCMISLSSLYLILFCSLVCNNNFLKILDALFIHFFFDKRLHYSTHSGKTLFL